MLKNYLRTALRNLWKHRGFSLLNIIGLTIGMVAFFLIFLYVRFELSYESMFSKADRIYRVVADIKTPTETINANKAAWAVPMHMRTEFQEVETAARVGPDDWLVTKGDQHFDEKEAIDDDIRQDGFKQPGPSVGKLWAVRLCAAPARRKCTGARSKAARLP